MEEFPQDERGKIINALESKRATRPCPRCGNNNFTLLNGYISHFVQSRLGDLTIGGPSVPTAVVFCTNCGWLAEHAIGALGLLPEKKEDDSKDRP